MSSSPSPSSSATSPPSSAASPPPLPSLSPPPISNPPPPSPPPPVSSAPAPASPQPSSPPPASPPQSPSTPSAASPPPVPTSPPPSSPPRPVASPPPVPVVPPPPTAVSPPPPVSESPPAPTAPSPPPPVAPPPPTDIARSPPPPIPASPPPPDPVSPPSPNEASPSPPSVPSSPRTPNAPPPSSSSPPPSPARTSPPPTDPPSRPHHPGSSSPPSIPSATPPKSPFTPLSPPSPPINPNDTSPPPFQTTPPLPSPNITPGNSINTTGPSSSNSVTPVSNTSSGNSPGGGGLKTGPAAAVGLVVVFVVLGSLGLAAWFLRRRKKSGAGYISGFVMPSPYTSSAMSESPLQRSPTAPLVYHKKSESIASEGGIVAAQSFFPYEELYEITNGFSPQNILGEGGFGCVYKGCLPDGRQVAVKQLKVGSGQGEREFKAEVEIISRVHHRHLVSLVGYCISENQRLLVYDFVPNDTLHSHLHGKGKPVIDWPTRVKVAAGAARGIAYLHEDCHPRIIHRDIKSSNILLDNNFEAQVSDFGLARLAMDAKTHVTTRVIGTFGYLAPEYASSGKLTDRSDVYSFGVVLLELITGRRPVDDSQPMGEESLAEWARPRLAAALETRDFGELLDPKLENNYNENEMFRMIEAAAACIRHSAAMRPQMGKVVRVLDALADVDLNNGVKPGQSELFNAADSADIRLFQRMAFGSQVFSPEYSHSNWSNQSDP